MENKPSLKEFFRIFVKDLATLMSGGLSVPFTAMIIFSPTATGKIIWSILTILAVFITIYRTWAHERNKVIALEESLDPGIEWHIMDRLISSSGASAYCLLEINNGNKTLKNCRLMLDNQLILPPFVLISGEKKPVPLFKFPRAISDTMTVVNSYVENDGKWQMNAEISRIITEGNYKLKLIAENLYPPLEMTVSVITHNTVATDWEIKEVKS